MTKGSLPGQEERYSSSSAEAPFYGTFAKGPKREESGKPSSKVQSVVTRVADHFKDICAIRVTAPRGETRQNSEPEGNLCLESGEISRIQGILRNSRVERAFGR